jgi:Mor family transcriptional regulator
MYTIEEIVKDVKNGATIERIYNRYGGFSVYIPKKDGNYREKIIEEFNGYNFKELASKYGFAVASIRRILHKAN